MFYRYNYSPEIIIENSRDEIQILRKRNLRSFIIMNCLINLLLLKHRQYGFTRDRIAKLKKLKSYFSFY